MNDKTKRENAMGPLTGLKIIEMAGLGPCPFGAMLLADLGASVVRVERKGMTAFIEPRFDILNRGKQIVALDLKKQDAVQTVLTLVEKADALVEGFRPGVMERLGLGPEICLARNRRLVYGRMTGWGQEGPLAQAAGHDLNYIALSGVLHAIGAKDGPPVPPLNLVGDFGGGGLLLALGVVCALLETQRSGQGQVVDTAMTDGAALQMAMTYSLLAAGRWRDERGVNVLDGGAHFYGTYECADGRWLAVGPIEAPFYRLFLEKCGITDPAFNEQLNTECWPELKQKLAAIFKTRSRAAWCELLEGTDACVAPVLSLTEAPQHPHNRARGTFIEQDGIMQPAPAPRFSRTAAGRPGRAGVVEVGEVLRGW